MASTFLPFVALAQSQEVPPPIKARTIGELIVDITSFVARIAVTLAAIAIIVVGFKFVSASVSGKVEGISEARKILLWVLIGTAIVVAARIIAPAIIESLKNL